MNNKVTKYSDLLRKQADMMDMVEGTELDWWDCVKFKGEMLNEIELKSWDNPQDYEFAVILVEGKPVFIGDILYDENGIGWTVGFTFDFNNKSWAKFKSKTNIADQSRYSVGGGAQAFIFGGRLI